MSAAVFYGRLGMRRGRAVASLVAVSLTALTVLALLGYGIAVELLLALVGVLLGGVLARLTAPRMREGLARRFGRRRDVAASILAVGLALGILLLGATLPFFVPSLIPAGGDEPYRRFVFGLGLGFVVWLREGLAPARESTPEEVREARRTGVRSLVVVGGAVAGLFVFTFAIYVVVEYVAGPMIRTFAP